MNKRSSDDELSQTSPAKRRRATDLPTTSSPTLRRSGRKRVPPLRTPANERRNGSSAHFSHYESSPHKQPPEAGASDTTGEDHPHRDPPRDQDDEKITVRLSLSSSSHTPASFNERSLRARAADPNEGRCLVTNTSDRAEATHVLDAGCSYLQVSYITNDSSRLAHNASSWRSLKTYGKWRTCIQIPDTTYSSVRTALNS
jgi:hypothetical protein